ncbi:MAG: hypothetical protein QGI46_14030 [Planctomycetota bacterium]|jgi:hypothetical protein|nr:hypothetical protein [Planctomycetota bacterium]
MTRYVPEGTGDHALQFALAQDPQTAVLWEACEGEDGACRAKITRDQNIRNVTWNRGTGSAGGNVKAKTGYVISARNGC